jgi:hypothetical protein
VGRFHSVGEGPSSLVWGSLGAVPVFKDVGNEGWLANRNVAVLFSLDIEAEEGEVVAFSVFNFPESILQLPDQVLSETVVRGHVKSV